jgi:hypothetical protein
MVPVKEHEGWQAVVIVGIKPLGFTRRQDFE